MNIRHVQLEDVVMNYLKLPAAIALLGLATLSYAAEEEHGHDEGAPSVVELSAAAREKAGIEIATVSRRPLSEGIRMPAEVVVNAYQSTKVTTRITAQVVARHVKLGGRVEAGEPLVTFSSVAMASAQGALIVADREWQRLRKLGKQAVSERRYIEAQVAQQQAMATVLAYGMTKKQAMRLLAADSAESATGEFVLLAPQSGTILSDSFIVGELIEPGRVLFDISDESTLWVEARMIPGNSYGFKVGSPARVHNNGQHWHEGHVIQIHHLLDQATRTQSIRIEVANDDDWAHPGQFVEAEVMSGEGEPTLAVPNTALVMIDGLQTVFVLDGEDVMRPVPVEVGLTAGNWTQIRSGLVGGEDIAVKGVFALKSLLMKSSLGEGHGH